MDNNTRRALSVLSMVGAAILFIVVLIAVAGDGTGLNAVAVAVIGGFGMLSLTFFGTEMMKGVLPPPAESRREAAHHEGERAGTPRRETTKRETAKREPAKRGTAEHQEGSQPPPKE